MDRRVMYDHTITTDWAATMHTDREQGHRMVMRLFHNADSTTLRSTMNILWIVTGLDTVLVRSNTPPWCQPDWAHRITTTVTTSGTTARNDPVRLSVDLVAQKTPKITAPSEQIHHTVKDGADGTTRAPGHGKAYRANKITVPTEELHQWAATKLGHHGLGDLDIAASEPRFVPLNRSPGGYPVTTVHATGTITDPDAWETALATGIGKGKAFGIGMITTDKSE